MKAKRVFGVLTVFMAGYLTASLMPNLFALLFARAVTVQESGSVGIIGGADGPTAIFTTSRYMPYTFWALLPLLLFAVFLGLYLYFRHKAKHTEKPEE